MRGLRLGLPLTPATARSAAPSTGNNPSKRFQDFFVSFVLFVALVAAPKAPSCRRVVVPAAKRPVKRSAP